ncbi:MAG TPA: hypothetical protein VHP12_01735, partial [Chitinophagaceae bacterium]|nr:hypothetical protein [Chitinophagaceae bacterium]
MAKRLPFLLMFLFLSEFIIAQQKTTSPFVTISGTVYDISARRPLEAVAVISTSGRGTLTDSTGRYSLTIRSNDSIYFKLLNKETMKYPVDTIKNTSAFDIMIHVYAQSLPDVKVRNS